MKKITFLLFLCLLLSQSIQAQAPQGFNYQAVARTSLGVAITSQNIGLQINILQGSAGGTSVYMETFNVTSNNIGLVNVVVGTGTVQSGTFNTINWANGPYYIEVSMDVTGGTSYALMGTQQLMSVPYALYAQSSGTAGAAGATGATGANGANGTNGINGNDGATGATGATGVAGNNGVNGVNGTNGTDGATGATGATGASGTNGVNGSNGLNGTNGAIGATGATGSAGIAGTDGNDGINGATGATGATGLAGSNGLNGANGNNGATGATGGNGTNGTNGTNGATGATGTAGTVIAGGITGQTLYYNGSAWTATSNLYNNATNIGIGTVLPEFKLSVDVDGGIIAKGTFLSGNNLLTNGSGTRMIFYPKKAAFRSGFVGGTQWDDANIGNYSVAMGNTTKASGTNTIALGNLSNATGVGSVAIGTSNTSGGISSFALGFGTTANGDYSTALGNTTSATQNSATAMGANTVASGINSTAMGSNCVASGLSSTAMGGSNLASGSYSTAVGYTTTASGNYSTAMGYTTTASGVNSTAIGSNVSSNLHQGALMLGDFSTATVMTAATDDIFMSRFNGGYKMYSNSALTAGVQLASGGGAWAAVSDRNKKDNFMAIDMEDILQKVASLEITNWNYKAQPKATRHIGCMAQDFYAAFHLDGMSDTTINTLDIDGINMVAIQALKKRTDELNETMKKLSALTNETATLRKEFNELKSENASLRNDMEAIKQKLNLTNLEAKK